MPKYFKKINKKLLLVIVYLIFFSSFNAKSFDDKEKNYKANHVTVLMYHRFGEQTYPSTNIKINQFLEHIKELNKKKYNVIDLNLAVKGIMGQKKIPDRSVAITIDDAYLSVYEKAWPILKKNNFKFALFVSTDVIDQKLSNYMNWDQIRELKKNGVIIGSQTKTHPHMHRLSENEIYHEINYSNKRFVKELGFKPMLFAYPYGEYNLNTIEVVKETGFIAAFGQHSGVAHSTAGLFQLPRFAMNENYGDLNRLKLSINALPMIVQDVSPINPFITNNPPLFGFTLSQSKKQNKIVRCFASNNIKTTTTRIGKHRIEVRLEKPFPKERGRINCTMEAVDQRWRWFGKQFMTK